MEFNQYNTTVQQWIHTVLENRETNADVVLECCRDIIAYGRETDDPKLIGIDFFRRFMQDSRFNDMPVILETPDDTIWRDEIKMLRSFEL